MKVGKYEFDTLETYEDAIADIDAIKNRVVYLGLSNEKYRVDVLWIEDITEHPAKWLSYAIDIEDEGIHYFHDYPYLENKF
tara:strand:- start:1739 stop:1981 length:243 start_codon:yes stop_codon:yes gene_type:complete